MKKILPDSIVEGNGLPGNSGFISSTNRSLHGELDSKGLYAELFGWVMSNNIFLPLGTMEVRNLKRSISFNNKPGDFKNINRSWINVGGDVISSDSVFNVDKRDVTRGKFSFVNGEEPVTFHVYRRNEAGLIEVHNVIKEKFKDFGKNYDFTIIYSQADNLKLILKHLYAGISISILGIFLLLFIVYRKIYLSLAVFLVLPFCLSGTFFTLWLFNRSINLMTLAGIILGIGICIDNCAITVDALTSTSGDSTGFYLSALTERIRGWKKTEKAFTGYPCITDIWNIKSLRKANKIILGSTLTTLAVFIPVFYFGVQELQEYRDFALSFSIMIIFSCIFALLLIPVFIGSLSIDVNNNKSLMINIKSDRICLIKKKCRSTFFRILNPFLTKPALLIIYAGIIIIVVILFLGLPYVDLSPLDSDEIEYQFYFSSGFSSDYKKMVSKELHDEVLAYSEKVGALLITTLEGDRVRFIIDYDHGGFGLGLSNLGGFFMELLSGKICFDRIFHSRERRILSNIRREYYLRKRDELLAFLFNLQFKKRRDGFFYFPENFLLNDNESQKDFSTLKQLLPNIKEVKGFFHSNSPGSLKLDFYGDDMELLVLGVDSASKAVSSLSGVKSIYKGYREGNLQLNIKLDSSEAYRMGINPSELIRFLRYVFYNPVLMKYYEHGEIIDVRAGIDADVSLLGNLEDTYVPGRNGVYVMLDDFSNINLLKAPSSISRKNGRRYIPLEIRYRGFQEKKFLNMVSKTLKDTYLPDGVYFTPDERIQERKIISRKLLFILLIGVFLVYTVLGIVLNSTYVPLLIIAVTPSALIGATLFLLFDITSRSAPVYMGIFLLVGISVNLFILLIEELHYVLGKCESDVSCKISLRGIASTDIEKEVFKAVMRRKYRILFITIVTTLIGVLPVFFISGNIRFFRVLTGIFFSGILSTLFFSVAVFAMFLRPLVMHYRRYYDKKSL